MGYDILESQAARAHGNARTKGFQGPVPHIPISDNPSAARARVGGDHSTAASPTYLLTKLLAPKLLASTLPGFHPRVIFVSSAAHERGTIDWADLAQPDAPVVAPRSLKNWQLAV